MVSACPALTRMSQQRRVCSAATVFARVALATAFLSAVADRFGLWGEAGTGEVGWGNFRAFTEYLQTIAPYLPAGSVNAAAWAVTVVELVLSVLLLVGMKLRCAALGSAITLVVFALSMFFFGGFETPLSASVFSAAAAALLLASAPQENYVISLDHALDDRASKRDSWD